MSQKKLNVRKGDMVLVISGKDSGKKGKVIAAYPKKDRIAVEGVNIVSKHVKPKSAKEAGGIIKKEGTINVSNVMIVCPACGLPTRVKNKIENNVKIRACKCGETLDKKFAKTKKSQIKEEKIKPVVVEKKQPKAADKNLRSEKKKVATATNLKADRLTTRVKRGDS